MKFYKVLNQDGSCYHGGKGRWPLPTQNKDGGWTPGEWMPALEGELVPCKHGYHVLEAEMLLDWIGPAVFEVEVAPCDMVKQGNNKWIVRGPCRLLRRMPIGDREWRLFACDCADRVVHLCGDDPRPQAAIDVARQYAEGQATTEELAAASAAVGYAELAAARYAVRHASSAAARHASSGAALAAASAAASAAKWDAERRWQVARLIEYMEGRAS